jgi:4,5:9,10-diseco-3-hydroxy-5,9,17-trioxoandrosta-1(10),2-diene-4-oate hydrolase
MKSLLALLLFTACTPALRSVTKVDRPLRETLAAPEPRALHWVLGVDLSVHDRGGDRPVVLCLHAIGHGGSDFAGVEAALGEDWRVIMVDWPGQGNSGPDAEPASAARYTQLLEDLVIELKLERLVILGNSIGGAVAMRYAAAHPTNVRALVLANPGGLDPGGVLARFFIGTLVDHFQQGVRNEVRFDTWFRDYYADILVTEASRLQRERIVAAGYEHAALLAQAWQSFAADDANVEALVPKLTMPVLFTWAKRDQLISWDRNRAAVERFPHAKVEFFEAGHSPFLETPGEFNQSLQRFLTGLER